MSTSKPRTVGDATSAAALAEGAKVAGSTAAAAAQAAPNPYARFIPREELGSFSAWNPGEFASSAPGTAKPAGPAGAAAPGAGAAAASGNAAAAKAEGPRNRAGMGKAAPAKDPAVVAAEIEKRVTTARQSGYQDGYRDGLSALENFKQTFTAQLTQQLGAQVGNVAEQFHDRLDALEQQLAGRLAGVALDLARQVVRSEISLRPELVVTVAEEALAALLTSARHVSVRLHPDDQAVVGHTLKEILHARGAKLVADPAITRGGCVIESDIAIVDASVEARWRKTSALLGSRDEWRDQPWNDDDQTEPRDAGAGMGDAA